MPTKPAAPSPFHHAYDRSKPVKPSPPLPAERRKGGFGTNGGTIPGMREPKQPVFNGSLRRK